MIASACARGDVPDRIVQLRISDGDFDRARFDPGIAAINQCRSDIAARGHRESKPGILDLHEPGLEAVPQAEALKHLPSIDTDRYGFGETAGDPRTLRQPGERGHHIRRRFGASRASKDQVIAEDRLHRFSRNRANVLEMGHPVCICEDDDIRRGPGLHLTGQCGRPGIRKRDRFTPGYRNLVQRTGHTGRRKNRQRRLGPNRYGKDAEKKQKATNHDGIVRGSRAPARGMRRRRHAGAGKSWRATLFPGRCKATWPPMKRFIPFLKSEPLVSVVRLSGAIAAGQRGGTLNDEATAPFIERAFTRGKPRAVALLINSPGGSPVQSSLIATRIRRLAEEKELPVHAFVEDVAASGGYWLACAADEIWADESSILGSIGVISASFGFHELIERWGIERRVHTAGTDKSMLDPFRPEREADIERLKGIQATIHESFIDHVKARRGTRLSADRDLFTGEFWTGARSVELGLADGIAHLKPKMQELYGEKTRFAVYGMRRGLLRRFSTEAIGSLDDRMQWARFGL